MRPIKFRAISTISDFKMKWNGIKHDGKWVYGIYNDGEMLGGIADAGEDYYYPEWWCPVDPKTVEQYTGIHDESGKEIYEGNIVHMEKVSLDSPESLTGLVEMVEGQWLVTSEKHQRAVPLYEETMVRRVFGDVHHNPKLRVKEATND